MKIDEIKTIVELMSNNDLTEFKIEAEECNLCIKRGGDNVPVIQQVAAAPVAAAPVAAAVPTPAPVAAAAADVPVAADNNVETIDSPIVGTFYSSPSPESPAFVKIGDTVTADSVVCIVEAMKVMNEIKAEKSGVIQEILVEDAAPVEYGQALFVIE